MNSRLAARIFFLRTPVYVIMPRVNSLKIVENPDASEWDHFGAACGGHLLQSAAWGELKARFGWSVLRLALARDDTLIAGAQILLRRLPLGLQFAYVPRGPIVQPADQNTVTALCDALCAAAKRRGAFALRLEPNRVGGWDWRSARATWLPANSVQPRTTIHLDLTRAPDIILAQMKPKWRYNIRLAERKGVRVRVGTADDLPLFYRLLQITGARDHFAIHAEAYYRAAFELLTAGDCARLLIAEFESEPLAAIFVTAFGGEAIYLYGASSNAHRDRMPNHALHWAAIQWARACGCVRYDLWGVAAKADALQNSDEPLTHGLYQFKQGFGGQLVQYVGGHDAVFSHLQYALFTRGLAWRRGGLG